jgi:hypothetical protein
MTLPPSSDRERVEFVLAGMYRDRRCQVSTTMERCATTVGRRQLERAFSAFETSPALEMQRIRAWVAAGALTDPNGRLARLGLIARASGFRDTRALRRELGSRWDVSPAKLRREAALRRAENPAATFSALASGQPVRRGFLLGEPTLEDLLDGVFSGLYPGRASQEPDRFGCEHVEGLSMRLMPRSSA